MMQWDSRPDTKRCTNQLYEQNSGILFVAFSLNLSFQALDFDGRPHWGKCGLAYHSADMILRRLDPEARAAFIG